MPVPAEPLGALDVDLWQVTKGDGLRLCRLAAADWSRPVPHCPGWDAARLVGHLGGIFAWIAQIVSTGQRVDRKDRPIPPEAGDALLEWYTHHLTSVLQVLTDTPLGTATWTFSTRGAASAGWWRRRLAVETAIHRWDIEHAAGPEAGLRPSSIHPVIAAAGIEEFVTEFLARLLTTPDAHGLVGGLRLRAVDADKTWTVRLDAGDGSAPAEEDLVDVDTVIEARSSDLLLWLTNRQPAVPLQVSGAPGVVAAWSQLRR